MVLETVHRATRPRVVLMVGDRILDGCRGAITCSDDSRTDPFVIVSERVSKSIDGTAHDLFHPLFALRYLSPNFLSVELVQARVRDAVRAKFHLFRPLGEPSKLIMPQHWPSVHLPGGHIDVGAQTLCTEEFHRIHRVLKGIVEGDRYRAIGNETFITQSWRQAHQR